MAAFIRPMVRPTLRFLDPVLAALTALVSPLVFVICRAGKDTPMARGFLDRIGIALVRRHYYEPVVDARDIRTPLEAPRELPALDLNERAQFELVAAFDYADELNAFPLQKPAIDKYGYINGRYGPGDAEMLYNMIRRFKPRRLIEVGSGQSTLMALEAIAANKREDAAYECAMTCVEPYEQPWLEGLGIDIRRERIEDCSLSLMDELGENDIFFIDSSHVIRPQGDVLHLFLNVLPRLKPGVLVQIHDIFTPRDYPAKWVIRDRRLWNEQYLLEAVLSGSSQFEVVAAVNWLANNHRDKLARACPVLATMPEMQPGAFWIRRK